MPALPPAALLLPVNRLGSNPCQIRFFCTHSLLTSRQTGHTKKERTAAATKRILIKYFQNNKLTKTILRKYRVFLQLGLLFVMTVSHNLATDELEFGDRRNQVVSSIAKLLREGGGALRTETQYFLLRNFATKL